MPEPSGAGTSDGDSIQVVLRLRPPDEDDVGGGSCLHCSSGDEKQVIMPCKPEQKVFTYDFVGDVNTTQSTVFRVVGKKTIDSCIAGYNGTIFAYGQTGSGKTFTMLGPAEYSEDFQDEQRGVIPRTFEYLFQVIPREQEMHGDRVQFLVKCSFLEIYNEHIYDLLDPSASNLQVREHIKKGVYVNGLTEETVSTASDAYKVLIDGWRNRRVGSTSMNRESSRSHAVFIVMIESKEKKDGIEKVKSSQLNLVDLAGSERQKDTNATGVRLKEGCNINKSLSTLGHVIMALVSKQGFVPYRDSKLSFLLRDSLGGNAKTFMIACVHTGAKFFGETLSTLQFARRAKMIKNKAVLNEDSHGSVAGLQAEIRNLKEQLLQYAKGNIPAAVTGSNNASIAPAQNTEEINNKWRINFVEAMYLRDFAEQDKKNLEDQLARMKDKVSAVEKTLMTKTMVIKFRDSSLAKFTKSSKRKEGLEQDEKDQIIDELRQEINLLKEQVAHNPEVTKYAVENQNLRAEIKQLKSLEITRNVLSSNRSKEEELERVFKELMKEKQELQDSNRRMSYCTPVNEPNVSTATVEKYKSQINNLQSAVDSAKQELLEQQAVYKKKTMELESETASLKKALHQLEKVLETHQIKAKIDRDNMNEMHVETLKTITTPKKTLYQLRNRAVLRPESGGSIKFDLSGGEEELLVTDEQQPELMTEQANEALVDEIKKLHEKNGDLLKAIQDKDSELIKMNQNVAKLEHQAQCLESERTDISGQKEQLSKQVETMSTQLQEITDHSKVVESEVQDLRILLNQADKEASHMKKNMKEDTENKEKERAAMETKIAKIEVQFSDLQKNFEKLQEEKYLLQESQETTQATLTYTEERMSELEELLRKEKESGEKLGGELQAVYGKLEAETKKTNTLTAQLEQAGHEQQQEVIKAMKENEMLSNEKAIIQSQLEAQEEKMALVVSELSNAKQALKDQEKQAEEDKEIMSGLMNKLHNFKEQISQKDDRITSLIFDLELYKTQCAEAQQVCENQSKTMDEKNRQLDELAQELETEKQKKEFELSVLQDDIDSLSEDLSAMQKGFLEKETEVEELKKDIERLQDELTTKQGEIDNQKSTFEIKIQEIEERAKLPEQDNIQLVETIQQKEREIENHKENEKKLKESLNYFEALRNENREEIQKLKTDLTDNEAKVAKLETTCQSLEYQLESERLQLQSRESDLQAQVEKLKHTAEFAEMEHKAAVQVRNEILAEREMLARKLSEADNRETKILLDLKTRDGDLQRLKEILDRDHEENNILKSRVDELLEEDAKKNKEKQALEERLKVLRDENAKLVGHQNPKQKIQFHMQIKDENTRLREELNKVTVELNKLKLAHKKPIESRLKENITPRKGGTSTPVKNGKHS